MVVIDVEIYKNYFLLSALQTKTGKARHFELYDNHPLDARKLNGLMRTYTTVSFNGNGFDLILILMAIQGATPERIKAVADKIIVDNVPAWRILRDSDMRIPSSWDHIDVMEVAPGQASLKIYGGRLNAPKMQDLPIEPSALITPEQREGLKSYCINDLETTWRLYQSLEKQIALRSSMSEQYGVDLRSKSDAQIAETVIKSELNHLTGDNYYAPKLSKNYYFEYRDPKIISFETDQLNDVFAKIKAHRFVLSPNGSVAMPDWLKKTKIEIGNGAYQMGIGGLHSCEKSQFVEALEGEQLYELDVSSYYPNIILQQGLSPETMGKPFLQVYGSIVNRRIAAKQAGNKVEADTLKICVNGSFGKLGSKYSALYSPDLLIQTTITGQLALLMLIEKLHLAGITIVSANTDGVVVHHSDALTETAEQIAWEWMLDTSYTLEQTHYCKLASRDVNNYIAVKPDGATKGKGVFADSGLMKNPNQTIIYKAVAEKIANGIPLEHTILGSEKITDFVTVRAVKGGAVWRGVELGKAVRFYLSTSVPEDESINYKTNGNRVAKSAGAKPLMALPASMPNDIDYQKYITAAEKLLCEVGFK